MSRMQAPPLRCFNCICDPHSMPPPSSGQQPLIKDLPLASPWFLEAPLCLKPEAHTPRAMPTQLGSPLKCGCVKVENCAANRWWQRRVLPLIQMVGTCRRNAEKQSEGSVSTQTLLTLAQLTRETNVEISPENFLKTRRGCRITTA